MVNGTLADHTHDHPVIFQQYFKSGARTYAAQIKQAGNGRPFLVLAEGKRDSKTDGVRKARIYVFDEDLPTFFRLLQDTAQFLRPLRQQLKHRAMQRGSTPLRPAITAALPPEVASEPTNGKTTLVKTRIPRTEATPLSVRATAAMSAKATGGKTAAVRRRAGRKPAGKRAATSTGKSGKKASARRR